MSIAITPVAPPETSAAAMPDNNTGKVHKKLHIQTHGCQMNEYDSQKMADVLGQVYDIEKVKDPAEADILIMNTCSIREKAQEKVFSALGRWKPYKDKNPDKIIAVGG